MEEVALDRYEYYFSKHPHAYRHLDEYINDDPWQMYRGFGCDAYIVSYYIYIDSELTNLNFMGVFK